MGIPTGRWPVENRDDEATTCSQCGTHFATPAINRPVRCPRCKATVSAINGLPWGTHDDQTAAGTAREETIDPEREDDDLYDWLGYIGGRGDQDGS